MQMDMCSRCQSIMFRVPFPEYECRDWAIMMVCPCCGNREDPTILANRKNPHAVRIFERKAKNPIAGDGETSFLRRDDDSDACNGE